jgi:hypothetical protein
MAAIDNDLTTLRGELSTLKTAAATAKGRAKVTAQKRVSDK